MPNRYTHQHGNLIIHFRVKFTQKNFMTNENQRKVSFSLFQFNL
jgi:hypothetical protein